MFIIDNQSKLKDLVLRDIPYTRVTCIAVPGVRLGRTNIHPRRSSAWNSIAVV